MNSRARLAPPPFFAFPSLFFASLPLLFAFLLATSAAAQGPPPPGPAGPPGQHDPVGESLFPPDLLMRHASAISLTPAQRTAIQQAIREAQEVFLDQQWTMQEESERLVQLLRSQPVDEAAALAQADRVMGIERTVKRAQLALLVRIKNLLSVEQQARLEELRRAS